MKMVFFDRKMVFLRVFYYENGCFTIKWGFLL
jgi:hypothetical protein